MNVKSPEEKRSVVVPFRLKRREYEAIRQIARRERRPIANWIYKTVAKALEQESAQ